MTIYAPIRLPHFQCFVRERRCSLARIIGKQMVRSGFPRPWTYEDENRDLGGVATCGLAKRREAGALDPALASARGV
jgi:hypothetical protein